MNFVSQFKESLVFSRFTARKHDGLISYFQIYRDDHGVLYLKIAVKNKSTRQAINLKDRRLVQTEDRGYFFPSFKPIQQSNSARLMESKLGRKV
jgi:hypothetical protein